MFSQLLQKSWPTISSIWVRVVQLRPLQPLQRYLISYHFLVRQPFIIHRKIHPGWEHRNKIFNSKFAVDSFEYPVAVEFFENTHYTLLYILCNRRNYRLNCQDCTLISWPVNLKSWCFRHSLPTYLSIYRFVDKTKFNTNFRKYNFLDYEIHFQSLRV